MKSKYLQIVEKINYNLFVVAICMLLVCVACFLTFMKNAMTLKDPYYRLVSVGLGVMYIFQVFLTVGGGIKFIPLTGVTLPFVSYGGSSVLVSIVIFMIMMMNSKSIATMKNLFTRLMLVAVAAMGFVACQEGYEDVTITPEAKEIVMTFVAEAPDTRTSVTIDENVAKYSWSEGDKVGFYYVATDVDYKKKGNSNVAVIADDGTASFTASFTPNDEASSYNIGAFYPGNSWVSHATENPFNNVKVKISNEQALTNGSFDPAADLMMSKPFMGVELNAEAVNTLEFTRIAAIGMMNLKLTDMVEGEVIKSVKFTLAEGIHFNGPVVLDLENSTYELGTTGTSNYVNLTGSLAANADRTAIFFTCFPGEYSGAYTIEVETDKATYSKTGELTKALTFTAGDVLKFNATVDRAEVEIPTDVYTLPYRYQPYSRHVMSDYSVKFLIPNWATLLL